MKLIQEEKTEQAMSTAKDDNEHFKKKATVIAKLLKKRGTIEGPLRHVVKYASPSPHLSWNPFAWIGSMKQNALKKRSRSPLNITIVCISDTHGHHRALDMPPGDILIHAGDYTRYGNREHAEDFNDWLGDLPYQEKIVVQGNHETNAPWKHEAKSILSNATLLLHQYLEIEVINDEDKGDEKRKLRIFGTEFFWPCQGHNPSFDLIENEVDIVVSHCPARGKVDNSRGCPSLAAVMSKVNPILVISGHEHAAGHSVNDRSGITYINAANAGFNHQLARQPTVITV